MSLTLAPSQGITLKSHQQQVHDFLVHRPFAGAWLGVGDGKTLTTLSVLQTVRPTGHILVVAPTAIARSTWIDEIEKWNFPIRTRSLIVNEEDRKLNKDKRLERFQQVFTDPPTMYFINQELLTQPSRGEQLITSAGAPPATPFSQKAADLLSLVSNAPQGLTLDELVDAYRDLIAIRTGGTKRLPAKTKIAALIRDLIASNQLHRGTHPCRACSGAGCNRCRFGLVDQMPIKVINGQRTIIWPFPTLIIDESQAFKSHQSERFRALALVRPAMTRVIELTGTPSPNGLHDLWSQIYLLDQGAALGANITQYRQRWFDPKMVPGTTTPAKWIARPGADVEIHAAIKHLVMSARNTSLKLPGDKPNIVDQNVTLPAHLLEAYKDFRKDLVLDLVNEAAVQRAAIAFNEWLDRSPDDEADQIRTQLHSLPPDEQADARTVCQHKMLDQFKTSPSETFVKTVVAENQGVLMSKLMQFASGTLYTADPDNPSSSPEYQVIHEVKLDMAEYLVRNNGGSPMLIPYHFRSDLKQLLTRFAKVGITAKAFDGSREMVRQWNAGQIPVLLLHPAAAGHGLNLQDGGYTMIWYTLPFSLEHYLQTIGRLFRTGQTKPVTVYRLITKGTQDERMPSVLEIKRQVQDQLIDAVTGEELVLAALESELNDDLNDMWLTERL